MATLDDELRHRNGCDDDVVDEKRESEERCHQSPRQRVDSLQHEQERGERPQPRDENDCPAVKKRLRGVGDNECWNEQETGNAGDPLKAARSATQLCDSARHQDVPRNHRDREGEVNRPEQPVRAHRAKLDTLAHARKQIRALTSGGTHRDRSILFARMSRRALFNLPNTMSLSRVVLALAFVLVSEPWDRIALIAVAAFTDFMDGWLVRHEKTESTAGALLDPIADRIFVFVAISTYLVEGQLTTAQYFIFLTRDLATAAGFIVAKIIPTLRPAVFRARMLGKIVTVVQLITLVAIVAMPEVTEALVLIIGLVSAASIVDYTIALWRGRARSSAA